MTVQEVKALLVTLRASDENEQEHEHSCGWNDALDAVQEWLDAREAEGVE